MTDETTEDFFAANRTLWDERVGIHLRDTMGVYGLDAIRRGEDVLTPIEGNEIGDVGGKRIAHLQCHFGLDSLSLARRGATVTGLDFSPVAIATARSLATELGIPATFVEANVYDAVATIGTGYDIVFVTWGTIGWLPGIARWARVVAQCLKPGGFLYLAEGHPMLNILDERDGRFVPAFDWRSPADRPIASDESTSYAGDGTPVHHTRNYWWNHPLSDVLTALLDAGLRLDAFAEHEMIPWRAFPSMQPTAIRMFRLPDGAVRFPLAFSLKATRT